MMSEKDKMLAGELYDPNDQELSKDRERARALMTAFNQSKPGDPEARSQLLDQLLQVSGKAMIEPPFYCDYGYNISVGKNFFANFSCTILDVNKVTIGSGVMFGPMVQLYTASHPIDAIERCRGLEFGLPIEIGDKVWIGGGAIICPGVKIGKHTTIGAGSVVTRDIPEGVFAAGNPCRVIKDI